MADPAVIEEVDAECRSFWNVRPDPLSHIAMAKTLTVPDSEDAHGRQEPYDPRSHPAQFHLLQAADGIINGEPSPRRYRRFLFLADAQGGGKSWMLQQIIFHGLIELSQSVIWALPTKGMAGDLWNLKLRPAWEGSGLGVYLPQSGPGSRGSAAPRSIRTQRLDGRGGGTLVFMSSGGRGQSGQAGLTSKILILDELGDWDKAAFTRIRKRVSKNNEIAVEWYGSTLKLDDGDLTDETYNDGTRTRVEYRCVHCNKWTAFEWKTWSGGDNPHIACLENGCIITEENRRVMLGIHRAALADPSQDIFSMKSTGLDCPWKSLAWLAGEEAKAKASEVRRHFEPMRTFYHDERVEVYAEPEPEGEINNTTLARMSERSTATQRLVPAWVQFLTMAVDVQGDRHYWQVMGHGPEDRWVIVDWGYEMLIPHLNGVPLIDREHTPADRRRTCNIIRDLANAGWQVEGRAMDDRRMRPVMRGIDVGFETKHLVAWIQGEPSWKAVRGVGKDDIKNFKTGKEMKMPAEIAVTKALEVRRPEGWRIWCHNVDGHQFRKAIHAALLCDADQPSSGMIPHGLKSNNLLVLHLSGEIWKEAKDGKPGFWFEARTRHDLLDCAIYNAGLALLHRHRPDTRDDGSSKEDPSPPPNTAPDNDWSGAVPSWT